MRAVVVSQDNAVSHRIQTLLDQWSWDCRRISENDPDQLKEVLASDRPDILIAVLPSDVMSEERIKELASQIRGKLVVVGPADPKKILRLLHDCAVDEYLDVEELEKELESLLRRSKREVRGKVIAVLSPSGGGGSSTLAANLAVAIARSGVQCAIIDLNLSTGDIGPLLDVKPQHSIADLAKNVSRMDNMMFSQLLTLDKNGLSLLAAPIMLEEIPLVNQEAVSTAIDLARNSFPIVVVDVDSSFSTEQITALELADMILVVFQLDFCSLKNVNRVLEYFWRNGVDKSSVKLIANRYGQVEELTRKQVETALKMPIDACLPEDRKAINRSANTGVPVVISSPRAAISKQIEQLVADLNCAA